jgi:RNA polymerase sigma-70 factor (ECF subfamily)
MNSVIAHLRRAVLSGADDVTDGRLLDEFRARRDEAAFTALLRRHGPMVLGVCRRVLRQQQDAEDAFQATFLVLARKAASIRTPAVGNWLYGVAYRTALKAKTMTAKRRVKERQAGLRPRPDAAEDWQELLPLLDRELSRLPERYRAPVVLCELEGKSRKEAAGQLGLPEGTLSSRLARGRALLARRLGGRAPAAVGVLALAREASAGVPAGLLGSTVTAATGTATVRVGELAARVLKGMLLHKLLGATALVLALTLAGLGAGAGAYQTGVRQGESPKKGFASEAGAKPVRPDLKWLEGTWEVITSVVDGNMEMPQDGTKVWQTFQGDTFTIRRGDTITAKGTARVDTAGKLNLLDCTTTEVGSKGRVLLSIFERLPGGDLRLCTAFLGGERPTEFTSQPGSRRVLQTLRRVKTGDAQGDAVRKELKQLEGTWEIVSVVGDGKKQGFGRPIRITIRGDRFTAERLGTPSDTSLIGKGPLKVDPSKQLKAIDFITTEGPGKGTKALMLYELKGDELRLCETRADDTRQDRPRPTEFSAGPGSGRAITTLRRVKSEE